MIFAGDLLTQEMSFLCNDGSQVEEDSASGVTMVEGRKMSTTLSFLDWNNDSGAVKRKRPGLDRMGSGVSCGDSYGCGEFVSRFRDNGRIGNWLGQMQMQNGYGNLKAADEMPLKHPLQSTGYGRCVEDCGGVVNMGSPGEGNSLRAGATGEERYRRVLMVENKGSPGCAGDEKYMGVHMAENNGSPGAAGEENSLRGGATVEDQRCRKVHMFDKAVTPSDVGKLNRLVIPKHHAEKYFPLDTHEKDKGLLLTFRDASGKEWRFRYSYWSSSQSYVLTKGWSRFVREMKLHAGDVVSFHRPSATAGADGQDQHFYISWKRRAAKAPLFFSPFQQPMSPTPTSSQWVSLASAMPAAPPHWAERLSRGASNWGKETPQILKLMAPAQQPPAENAPLGADNSLKRIRLFGVNL